MPLALLGFLYRAFVRFFTGTPSQRARAANALDRYLED